MSTVKTIKKIREDLSGVDFIQNDEVVASIYLADLPKEVLTHLALHGASQKIGDSYSGEKDPSSVVAKAQAVIDRLIAGDWKAARTSASPRATQLAQALANVFSKTLEQAVDVLSALDKEQTKELRADPRIAAELQRIAAEKAAEKAAKAAIDAENAPASSIESLLG